MTTKILDSNVCIGLLRGVPRIRDRYADEILDGVGFAISSISLSELWYGVDKSVSPHRHASRLTNFLALGPAILDFDVKDARAAGRVRAQLSRAGRMIGGNDLLIGSQGLARGLTVVTGNVREFSRIPGLAIEDWSQSE